MRTSCSIVGLLRRLPDHQTSAGGQANHSDSTVVASYVCGPRPPPLRPARGCRHAMLCAAPTGRATSREGVIPRLQAWSSHRAPGPCALALAATCVRIFLAGRRHSVLPMSQIRSQLAGPQPIDHESRRPQGSRLEARARRLRGAREQFPDKCEQCRRRPPLAAAAPSSR